MLKKIKFIVLIIAAMGVMGVSAACIRALADDSRSSPKPGLKPIDETGRMQISSRDRCPVCAMWVAKYKKFAAGIQLTDGTTYYFCGCGCMIRCWLHPEIYLSVAKEALKRPVVQDYFTGEQTDGRSAYWVAGSDVIGPMGPAVVPIADARHIEVFKRRHGAKAIFRLSELTDGKWQQWTGHQPIPEN